MPLMRGDVILTYVPNVGQTGGKLRPAVVVQSNHNNVRLNETIIAAVTSNTSRSREAHQVLIDVASSDGAASGLLHNSSVRGERLHTIAQSDAKRVIGQLSNSLMAEVNTCLKAALGLP